MTNPSGRFDPETSLETWMSAGGDHRQVPDPTTGLTKYRTATRPRTGIPLGSCTASWPSERAWEAMGQTLERWRMASDGSQALEATANAIRAGLREWAEWEEGGAVALAPSGTDVLYLINAIGLQGWERVHHVVVGASELGGGTMRACRGLTFSALTPFQDLGGADRPVPGLYQRCSAEPVYLRDDHGHRMDMDEVDREVDQRVRAALAPGRRVVLHLVAHSKTGLRAPSLACAKSLVADFPDQVLVLVDAAQGRLSPADVRTALGCGFMVLFTGSKFYSGPTFSGAVFLPEALADDPGPLPEGVGSWTSQVDLPERWTLARGSLPEAHNPGMLLRWTGALAEIAGYHAINPRERGRVYHTFASAVLEAFGPSDQIEVDMPMPPVHRLVTALGAYPTVFGFQVIGPSGPLDHAELSALHHILDTDLAEEHPELGERFHLGQPVALGNPSGGYQSVLRVALGAGLITDLASHDDAGAAWLRGTMGRLRAKIERVLTRGDLELA